MSNKLQQNEINESIKTNKTKITDNNINSKLDSVLQEALNVVHKDRVNQYGNPENNFEIIASYWDTYIRNKHQIPDEIISSEDIPMMMILLKVARESYDHKRDNLVDIAGYVECADIINNRS